jgi:hypothetical protein
VIRIAANPQSSRGRWREENRKSGAEEEEEEKLRSAFSSSFQTLGSLNRSN